MATFSSDSWVPGKGGRFPRHVIFRLFQYQWFEEVVGQFHASEARIRIPCAPARTSKSFSCGYDALPHVLPTYEVIDGKTVPVAERSNDDRRIWLVGPDYSLNKEFDYLHGLLVRQQKVYGLDYKVVRASFSPKQGNMDILLEWGEDKNGVPVRTRIQGMSATNPESLQAEEVDYCAMSEAAEQPEKIWSRYLSTRVKLAVLPTTPKIHAAWLQAMIELGESNPDLSIETFRFTPRCNPLYDWERYWEEHAKAEARMCGQIVLAPRDPKMEASDDNGHDCFADDGTCVAMRDPHFAEQFGGRWTFEADRVLPFRWTGPGSHVLDDVPDWWEFSRYYVSVDYGFTDPSCVLWWAVGTDGTVLCYRELYESKMDPRALVERIHRETERYNESIEYFVGDPQQPGVEKVMREIGLPVSTRDKGMMRDRAAGGMKLVEMLSPDPATGRPKLYVLSEKAGDGFGCPRTIAEWKTLRRSENSNSEWTTAAIKGADHAFDAARYFLMSHPRTAPVSRIHSRMMEDHRRQVLARERRSQWASGRSWAPMGGF